MSRLRKWWVLARHPHATVRFTEPVYLGPRFSVHIPANGTFICGPYVEFRRGFRAEISGDGRIEIGAGTVFTYDVLIQCSTLVKIGEHCQFGQATQIVDGQHRYRDPDRPLVDQGYDFRDIVIEDGATAMSKVTIMASLGRRAVVGANAVVTKDIPAYSVAVGVPARVIDSFAPA